MDWKWKALLRSENFQFETFVLYSQREGPPGLFFKSCLSDGIGAAVPMELVACTSGKTPLKLYKDFKTYEYQFLSTQFFLTWENMKKIKKNFPKNMFYSSCIVELSLFITAEIKTLNMIFTIFFIVP